MIRHAAILVALMAGPVWADAPASSLRPEPRPMLSAPMPTRVEGPRVVARVIGPARGDVLLGPAGSVGLVASPRPDARPDNLRRRNTVARVGTPDLAPSGVPGAICGSAAIRGVAIAPVPGRIAGCGVAEPVKVSMVQGVALSRAATMDCRTAQALSNWVGSAVRPAIGRLGGGVTGLRVAAGYACRTRNNQPGGKVSEHGKGRAIDVSAFRLANGAEITVLKGWRDSQHGPILRRIHRGACGPFGTVLGPESDRFHKDHFHLDTARYRSGSYCR
ncbi:hypothetical protein PARPLA_00839 [Rhodobacteraceae bacterium THAF1]|uniref:extensin-like domain-containing protein n=1 Tax=Palleronia sp. THAF1 TaxID=2587842 RepID=UPI000F3F93F4|nr:extensin family protein [Palleronia sp. THAF1]QFU09602.1 hypothetical protein FIU81_13060 [Palleronia sp. THAF1]VDC17497.1 hypothetical protein PARPLA_00839 [Rhodobacteraceae bacterium THAF1]